MSIIDSERIQALNNAPVQDGNYVLYWMQATQRVLYNHALAWALERGRALRRPVVVGFGLTDQYPAANLRHYTFMLQGLAETAAALRQRGVQMVLRRQAPDELALALGDAACEVVADGGYLRHQRQWRRRAAAGLGCRLTQVESDVVVPVETAYEKEAYSAAVLRRPIHQHWPRFMKALRLPPAQHDSLDLRLGGENLDDTTGLLSRLDIDHSVAAAGQMRGGPAAAEQRLRRFVSERLENYETARNDPTQAATSELSAYLHYGQISPLQIALAVDRAAQRRPALRTAADAFLEELIVRRELAINFVHYNRHYDDIACLPNWARNSLNLHRRDRREYVYRRDELEAARTHDPYWNAAQTEMVRTGRMAGYMRMYWGKKLIEWTARPAEAYRLALYLNDKYELDGRDPNGYAGVAWCFGKHDRPWSERRVFGTVRYMNDQGLRRKFDADAYVRRTAALPEG